MANDKGEKLSIVQREPVRLGALVGTTFTFVLMWLSVFGVQVPPDILAALQEHGWAFLGILVGIPAVAEFIRARGVTPVLDPHDMEGNRLTPEGQ